MLAVLLPDALAHETPTRGGEAKTQNALQDSECKHLTVWRMYAGAFGRRLTFHS